MNSRRPDMPNLLSDEDREILAYLRQQELRKEADRFKIARCDRKQAYPLSSGQEGVWFQDQIEPGNPAYHFCFRLHFGGPFQSDALRAALNEVVRRHDALRARFVMRDLELVQIIAPPTPVELPFVDLSDRDGQSRERETNEMISRLNEDPFDLSEDSLVRCLLIRHEANDHLLAMCFHHIIFDRWSMGVFVRELNAVYASYSAGRLSPLEELPIQYTDYAVWERETQKGEAYEKSLQYWLSQLADLSTLTLPTDRPRPANRHIGGGEVGYPLPRELTDSLRNLANAEEVTLFGVYLTGFSVMLQRLTGQFEAAIGTPVSNRNLPELEALIGYFLNTLVLRVDLSGDPSVRELLGRVREVLLAAYRHQNVPFETLVEKLAPKRDPSMSPLFQVSFVHFAHTSASPRTTNTSRDEAASSHSESPVLTQPDKDFPDYDLEVFITEDRGETHVAFHFRIDVFDQATIVRMFEYYARVLVAMVSDPGQRIGDIPLLGADERARIIEAGAGPRRAVPGKCVHELFEEQAERTPEAVAVVFEDRHLTYGELNARANQLAHHLTDLGIGPEVLVGLALERSLELAVGLLGILKAGGAYVPLDPSYPRQRLEFMLRDSQAPVLVTQHALVEQLPTFAGRTICLDPDWTTIAAQSTVNLRARVTPENLAYVIYTSGSTGQPKGVLMEHRPVVNHMAWMREEFGFNDGDAVLQRTPISFDAAGWEFFMPLLVGGRLVMAPPEAHRDPVQIVAALREQNVSTVQLVPSLFQLLTSTPELAACTALRRVFCGGEVLPRSAVRSFRERSGATVCNLYGPTEACIDATFWVCGRDGQGSTVLIGRPIWNTQVYILDSHGNPAPVGVAGELFIGGNGLARGYLHRPELTVEKFVPDPFSVAPDARLYRTGDRARYSPDGAIEFLGRIDNQVKLRGNRIELGEIEAVLAEHPAVRESVVLVREVTPGDERLVAYVVAAGASADLTENLRAHLRARLPDYMLPSVFVALDRLPLMPNGKVDRGALPATPDDRNETVPLAEAESEMEQLLADVWRQALGVARVGVRDNFFDLGGHSLLVIRVIEEMRRRTGVAMSVREYMMQDLGQIAGLYERERALDVSADSSRDSGPIRRGRSRRVSVGGES